MTEHKAITLFVNFQKLQRQLFADFLDAYRPVIDSLRFGHPLAVEDPADPYPDLDFGPVINAEKASELRTSFDEGVRAGGIPLVKRALSDGVILEGQDTSAYVAPATRFITASRSARSIRSS